MAVHVTFLNHDRACDWIRQHHTEYISRVLKSKANRANRTYTSINEFCEHVVDWTPEERRELRLIMKKIFKWCWSWKKIVCEDVDWTFILVNDQLESGMPHTIDSAIVLPRWILRRLLFETETLKSKQDAYETLIHERIHVLQKKYPNKFTKLYEAWGWTKVPKHSVIDATIDKLEKQLPTRLNPDTPNRWQYKVDSKSWIPYTRMNDTMQNVKHYLILVDYDKSANTSQSKTEVNLKWSKQDKITWYTEFYGDVSHCYHPDETSAVLLAECITADINKSRLRKVRAVKDLLQWCHREW